MTPLRLPRFPPRGDGSEGREDLVHLEARGVWWQTAHKEPQMSRLSGRRVVLLLRVGSGRLVGYLVNVGVHDAQLEWWQVLVGSGVAVGWMVKLSSPRVGMLAGWLIV